MHRYKPLVTTLAIALALGASARADEITDQMEDARKSYEAGDLRAAVQSLQFTVASIQEKINLSLLKLLPEPPEGWSADEPQAASSGMAAMFAGTNLSRHYYRADGADANVNITADSPFLPMMTMMLSNPMMLQADPSTRLYTHEGRRGTIKQEGENSGELNLMLNGNVLLQVSITGAADKDTLESFLKTVDLEAIEKAFGG